MISRKANTLSLEFVQDNQQGKKKRSSGGHHKVGRVASQTNLTRSGSRRGYVGEAKRKITSPLGGGGLQGLRGLSQNKRNMVGISFGEKNVSCAGLCTRQSWRRVGGKKEPGCGKTLKK